MPPWNGNAAKNYQHPRNVYNPARMEYLYDLVELGSFSVLTTRGICSSTRVGCVCICSFCI